MVEVIKTSLILFIEQVRYQQRTFQLKINTLLKISPPYHFFCPSLLNRQEVNYPLKIHYVMKDEI